MTAKRKAKPEREVRPELETQLEPAKPMGRSEADLQNLKTKVLKLCGGGDVMLAAKTIKESKITDAEYHDLVAVHPALKHVLDGL